MGSFCSDFRGVNIDGTNKPWLFTSGYRGLLRCEIPLTDDANSQEPGIYNVSLGFKAMENHKIGQRVFDLKIHGKVVLKDFDIMKLTKTDDKVILKFAEDIQVKNNLTLEICSKI